MPETRLTLEIAERFAAIALGHVTREYPNKLDHVMVGPDDVRGPRVLHPIFYGSFDWHSCVHGYWMLARLARCFPEMKSAAATAARFADAFTEANVAEELAYLRQPASRSFERPYGWVWALMLAAELHRDSSPYAQVFRPLEIEFVSRLMAHLPMLTYPIRTGTHNSTAFALILAAEYAALARNEKLLSLLQSRARDWFGKDQNAPAWEPGGDDFLSPTLCEAEAMRRLLPREEFVSWFDTFLPALTASEPSTLFCPVTVSDRSDGKTAHLDGLNLSRAWCMKGLASAMTDEPRHRILLQTADNHIATALPHIAGDYMGEHWLATFATLALNSAEGA